jgi:hypothetical protein
MAPVFQRAEGRAARAMRSWSLPARVRSRMRSVLLSVESLKER